MEIVYGTATKVLELLATNAYQEISLAWGVRDELRKLQQTVSIIQAVLLDAEEKQSHNRQISVWLAELKDVLLDAEELLGEFECEDLKKKVGKLHGSTRRKVSYFFSGSNPLVFCFSFGRKIKEVRNKLIKIAAKKKEFGLEERHERNQIISEKRVTHSYVRASDVIGREDDKENVIHLLMEPCDKSNVSVIPIRGIGGLGKTTLAKLVYNDERVQSHFELKMWVCVSENFDVPRLIKEILDSATGKVNEELNLDQLQKGLRDKLEAQRFLLILDDVWSDSREKWFALKELLMVGSEGSKIIVSTRKQSVADLMGTRRSNQEDSTYILKGLPSKDCLSLFIKWAFKDGDDEQHPNLVKIGEQIVAKCKGLPLAVTTLGSLLYSKLDEGDWKYIRDNEIWKLEQKEDHVLPALQLSYNELPSYLKRCFHYCSLFPKDYRFKSWELIPLWMAHGLIFQPDSHRNKSFEEIGELYFKQLWSRSFFQDVVEHSDSYGFYTFSMHDLIHDLAQLMSKNECSTITSPTDIVPERVRHLSITCSCDEELACLDNLKSVHAIIVSKESHLSSPSLIEKYILKFKFLRVLGLSDSSFEVLPSDIGRMKHLRYLNLSSNGKIRELPSSICKLQSLQSLLLGGCTNLKGLPSDINCLISLRHLVITTTATSLPKMECLTSLNDLWIIQCPNLISLPKSVRCLTLEIHDCKMLTLREDKDNDQVSKLSLRRLTITNLPKLVAVPQWLRGCEGTLQFLKIDGCPSFTALPQWLPKATSLETLKITDCTELQSLPAEEMHLLSSLRKFKIEDCPKLRNSIKAMKKEWLQSIDFQCDLDYEEDEEAEQDAKFDHSVSKQEIDDSNAGGEEEIEQDFTVGPSLSKLEIGEHSGQS